MAGRSQSVFAGSNGAVVGFAQSYARSGRVEVVAVGLCVAAVVAVLGGGGDVGAEVDAGGVACAGFIGIAADGVAHPSAAYRTVFCAASGKRDCTIGAGQPFLLPLPGREF